MDRSDKSTKRIPQINERIKRELSEIFLREIDFLEKALITIIKVETSSNLIHSKIWISVIPESQTEKVFRVLNKKIYYLQQILNKRLRVRPMPKIKFIEEKEIKQALKVEQLLDEIRE